MKEHIETILKNSTVSNPTKSQEMQIMAAAMAIGEEIDAEKEIGDDILNLFKTQEERQLLFTMFSIGLVMVTSGADKKLGL